MSNLHIFTYNNHQITFDFNGISRMINATEMAKVFGKKTQRFMKSQATKAYLSALEEYLSSRVKLGQFP